MTKKVKKAIIDIQTDRGKFLPLSECVPKELFLLGNMPVLKHLTDEAISIGAEDIIFLTKAKEPIFKDFFKDLKEKETFLKKKGIKRAEALSEMVKLYENISFSYEKNLSTAVRKADDFLIISSDIVINSKRNACEQLMNIFKTSERPVIGLRETEMGDLEAEKIAKGLYKIKAFADEATLKLIGRGVFTAESRKFFEGKENLKEAIETMIDRGHTIYGTIIDGDFFDLTDPMEYAKANFSYNLKSSYGEKYKAFVKNKLQ